MCSRCRLVPRPERFIQPADRTKIEPTVGEGGLESAKSFWTRFSDVLRFDQISVSLFSLVSEVISFHSRFNCPAKLRAGGESGVMRRIRLLELSKSSSTRSGEVSLEVFALKSAPLPHDPNKREFLPFPSWCSRWRTYDTKLQEETFRYPSLTSSGVLSKLERSKNTSDVTTNWQTVQQKRKLLCESDKLSSWGDHK